MAYGLFVPESASVHDGIMLKPIDVYVAHANRQYSHSSLLILVMFCLW